MPLGPLETGLRRGRLQGPGVASSPQSERHVSFAPLLKRLCSWSVQPFLHPARSRWSSSVPPGSQQRPRPAGSGCWGQTQGLEESPGCAPAAERGGRAAARLHLLQVPCAASSPQAVGPGGTCRTPVCAGTRRVMETGPAEEQPTRR